MGQVHDLQPGRGNVGMPEPLLHFGNIGIVCQGIGGTQRMHAEAMHIGIDAHHPTDIPLCAWHSTSPVRASAVSLPHGNRIDHIGHLRHVHWELPLQADQVGIRHDPSKSANVGVHANLARQDLAVRC